MLNVYYDKLHKKKFISDISMMQHYGQGEIRILVQIRGMVNKDRNKVKVNHYP